MVVPVGTTGVNGLREQKSLYEVNEFWLSNTCLSYFNLIWIHEREKNPWKKAEANCSCVTNSDLGLLDHFLCN